jgi:hypothetical protein
MYITSSTYVRRVAGAEHTNEKLPSLKYFAYVQIIKDLDALPITT